MLKFAKHLKRKSTTKQIETEHSKWILIEVKNHMINQPNTYNTYAEAFEEMKRRYKYECKNSLGNATEASIDDIYAAHIKAGSYNAEWLIYKVNMRICDAMKEEQRYCLGYVPKEEIKSPQFD